MSVLFVCAVEEEARAVRAAGALDTLVCGVGPVEAACMVAARLAADLPSLVVVAGIAGGFAPLADVGDRVVVTTERYVDLGREDGEPLSLPGGASLHARADADAATLARLATVAARFGPAITSATITTADARAGALRERVPGAVCEAMEGFGVFRASALAGVAAIELRGVSNRVGDRATSGWNLEAGLTALHDLTRDVLERL